MVDPSPIVVSSDSLHSIDTWIHIAELVVVIIIIPITRSMIAVIVSLRDATRDLTKATQGIKERLEDHENRIRWVEGSPDRRQSEYRGHQSREDRH